VTGDVKDIRRWAASHLAAIAQNQKSKRPYDRVWSKQRIDDVRRAVENGLTLEVKDKKRAVLNRILMPSDSYHALFLFFDRPPGAKAGRAYDVEVRQIDVRYDQVLGGLSGRIELVPNPPK